MSSEPRTPTLIESLIPIIFLIMLLSLNVFIFSDDATYGSNQIALLLAATLAARLGIKTPSGAYGMPLPEILGDNNH